MLALPEDMLRDVVECDDLPGGEPQRRASRRRRDGARAVDAAEAQRPLMILGGSGWDEQTRAPPCAVSPSATRSRRHARSGAKRCSTTAIRVMPATSGSGRIPRWRSASATADLILALGGRLGEIPTSGYTLIEAPRPRQRLIHVHADPDELGRVFAADVPINAGPAEFARALDATRTRCRIRPGASGPRPRGATTKPRSIRATLRPGWIWRTSCSYLDQRLPEDAILCNGAGNYTTWLHRFFRYKGFATQLGPTAGAMGYGFPAAIAAKLQHPERIVVAVAGDGCFLMTGQELATAAQYGANVVVLVVNNGMYGTIRMHQERAYPGRVSATGLANPDFVAFARAFGAHGALVTRTAEFGPAFERRLPRGGRP